jgi:hypothetical protein
MGSLDTDSLDDIPTADDNTALDEGLDEDLDDLVIGLGDSDDDDSSDEGPVNHGGSDDEEYDEDFTQDAENLTVMMPSLLSGDLITKLDLESLAFQEFELRQGQANDHLEDLRLALGHLALVYRTQVRRADTTKKRTRAWKDVKAARNKVEKHARGYRQARRALVRLGAGDDIMEIYQPLNQEEIRVSKDITDERRLGQRNDTLPWFWRISSSPADDRSD